MKARFTILIKHALLPLVGGQLTLLFLAASVNAQEQEVLPITLEKVLELSGANNLTIKEYKERQNLAQAEVARAKEWWLPEVYGGVRTQQLSGAVMNGNGNFFLDVKRNNLWLGLGVSANWNFTEGINTRKAVEYESQASTFRTEIERNKELTKAINAYYNLVSAQLNLVAYKSLVIQSDTIILQIQIQLAAGLGYQSDLLLAQSNKRHLRVQMLNAQRDYNAASSDLRMQLNLDQNIKLVSVDEALLPLDYSINLIDPADSIHKNRPELKANDLEIMSLRSRLKITTTGHWVPELGMGANGSYYGRINGKVNPMDALAYPVTNQLYPTGTFNTSLIWKIPLGVWTYNGDSKKYNSLIRIKEIEAEQFKAQINEEIALAITQIQTGKEQIEIAKEGVELTTEALSQSMDRQGLGTAKPFEVFQAQQFFLQAQIDYLQSVSEYNKAQFALKVAKGENL
jgi:outer membrane protein TolC